MAQKHNELKLIGKVIDAHGIRGDIYCLIFSGDNSWVTNIKSIVLDDQEFKVLKIKTFKKGFIATLEGVTNRNQAEELKSAEVRVDSSIFISGEGESLFLSEILNFEVTDKATGTIGKITSFSSNGAQDLLVIENSGKTYEIPFVKDFVINIDHKNNVIQMILPEGLLEINEKNNVED